MKLNTISFECYHTAPYNPSVYAATLLGMTGRDIRHRQHIMQVSAPYSLVYTTQQFSPVTKSAQQLRHISEIVKTHHVLRTYVTANNHEFQFLLNEEQKRSPVIVKDFLPNNIKLVWYCQPEPCVLADKLFSCNI